MLALFAGEDEIGGRGRIELVDFKGPVEHRNVPPKKIHEHALARLEHGAKCRIDQVCTIYTAALLHEDYP